MKRITTPLTRDELKLLDNLLTRFLHQYEDEMTVYDSFVGVEPDKVLLAEVYEVLEEQLRDFSGKLQKLLLLDHPYCWKKLENAPKIRRRTVRNLLSIKIHAFDPDRLLTRMEKRLSFCFSTAFSALLWFTVFVAVIISILNWESLFVSLGTLFSLYSIPLIIIVVFATMTVHEFAVSV